MFFISKETQQINNEIKDKELRVISADGEQLGIMSASDALHIAETKGLDLVKIAPQAKPPVCKIMDYSKFRYEQAKREKENRKNQKQVETKEIRLSVTIDVGDFNTKVNQAKKFLASGHKVKVSIRLKGRMMTHSDLGIENMKRFAPSQSISSNTPILVLCVRQNSLTAMALARLSRMILTSAPRLLRSAIRVNFCGAMPTA